MSHSRALKLLLKRGALVAAANWPVVLVQFVADALFKALLAVPIAGGVLLVVLLAGVNPSDLWQLDLRDVVPAVVGVLLAHPAALAAFLVALGLVAAGGSVIMFAVKAGTLSVLVAGEREAGALEHPPLRLLALARANRFSIERFTAGLRRLFTRYLTLGCMLGAAYAISIGVYGFLVFGPPLGEALDGAVIVTLASVWLIALITLINFLYLLAQIIVAADDCGVGEALRGVARLVAGSTGPILGVLGAILGLMALTTAASVLATAALGLIAFVPFVGLAALPMQVIAWLMRGLVFQYISLAGAASYLRLHLATDTASVPALSARGLDGVDLR